MAKHFQNLKEIAKKKQPGRKRPRPKTVAKGQYPISDVEHFREFFGEFAHQLAPGDLLLFGGDVGAGKTEAIRAIVEQLGGRWVSSPSFAIHQRYAVRNGFIDHIDLYRLEDDSDLESTGFWDLFDLKDSIIAIEWADRMPLHVWPQERRKWIIKIGKPSENERLVQIA